tara:strand:+ start:363 stop:707 length:345 start_codon:yes stop_codon:yes gene_type:complete
MLTFIYPILSKSFGINNKIGFFLFLLISFMSIHLIGKYINKLTFDLSELVDKNIYNTLVIMSTYMILDDFSDIVFTNSLGIYLMDLSKSIYSKNIVMLLPFVFLHFIRALLRPY